MADPLVIGSIRGGVTEVFAPGDRPTFAVKSGEKVSGGMVVEVTDDWEVQASADQSATIIGVALYDGDGDKGEKVTVANEGVWMLSVNDGGGVDAGEMVVSAGAGEVKAFDGDAIGTVVGKALAAGANDALIPVLLTIA